MIEFGTDDRSDFARLSRFSGFRARRATARLPLVKTRAMPAPCQCQWIVEQGRSLSAYSGRTGADDDGETFWRHFVTREHKTLMRNNCSFDLTRVRGSVRCKEEIEEIGKPASDFVILRKLGDFVDQPNPMSRCGSFTAFQLSCKKNLPIWFSPKSNVKIVKTPSCPRTVF